METKNIKQPKLHIRRGDKVVIIAGDEKGKTGTVVSVDFGSNRAIVEGLNMVTKHNKPTASNPNGGIVKKEAPIHVSNIAVADPKTGKATKIGRKADKAGKLVRYAKKSGEVVKNG
jgi:large subunit ribosomal protein L24